MIHLMRLLDGTFLEAYSEFVFLCGKNLYIVVALGTVLALAVSRVDLIKGKAPGILHISCLLMSVGFFFFRRSCLIVSRAQLWGIISLT